MVSKLDDFFRFQTTALSIRGERQQLIASNIANADTPNYKAKDVDFTSALNNALGRSNASNGSQAPEALGEDLAAAPRYQGQRGSRIASIPWNPSKARSTAIRWIWMWSKINLPTMRCVMRPA